MSKCVYSRHNYAVQDCRFTDAFYFARETENCLNSLSNNITYSELDVIQIQQVHATSSFQYIMVCTILLLQPVPVNYTHIASNFVRYRKKSS